MADWIKADIIENKRWGKDLFSLILDADINPFIAGQFTKLGMELDGEIVQRAYSFVNPPQSKYIEIHASRIAEGTLSPKLHALESGDQILITKDANGFFTLNEIPSGEHLWMIATGTAIGPYLSILREETAWKRFRKIILIHGVRYSADLSYQSEINELAKKNPDKFNVQPFVTREPDINALSGRITHALKDGMLERITSTKFDPIRSQVMLCGNPHMVKNVQELLLEKGLKKNRRSEPGNITTERYW